MLRLTVSCSENRKAAFSTDTPRVTREGHRCCHSTEGSSILLTWQARKQAFWEGQRRPSGLQRHQMRYLHVSRGRAIECQTRACKKIKPIITSCESRKGTPPLSYYAVTKSGKRVKARGELVEESATVSKARDEELRKACWRTKKRCIEQNGTFSRQSRSIWTKD